MMKTKSAVVMALALGSLSLSFLPADAAEPDLEMLSRLKRQYPATRFTAVTPAPISGLWEVHMGDQIAYSDASGRYFLFGSVMDMQTQKDLTADKRSAAAAPPVQQTKVTFPANFLNNAIKTVRGDGSRVLAVFSDPQCPYCKVLETELAKLQNVTIYTFLYPILAEESKTKSVSIWCSGDRQKSWQELMLGARQPRLAACNNPVNENLVLGSRLGIQATPALISADGRLLVGATTSAHLDAWLVAKGPDAKWADMKGSDAKGSEARGVASK